MVVPPSGQFLFTACLVAGVALAVFFGFRGVQARPTERRHTSSSAGVSAISVGLLATSAAMAVFGGVGIFLLRGGASLEAAALAGGLAALVALGSVAALLWRWLAKHSEDEQHLSEEFLQGLPVRVARAVDACDGEVEYADGGITRRVAARALGGSRYGEGDEVVIDHRKDGVVYVEAWSRVEERL